MSTTTSEASGGGPRTVRELRLTDGGCWAVRSKEPAVIFVDLDERMMLRQPGPGAFTGPYDGVWTSLVSVDNAFVLGNGIPGGKCGAVQVGRWHFFHLDPKPHDPTQPWLWWLQPAVTAIEAVAPEQRPVGRQPEPDEDGAPYTRLPAAPDEPAPDATPTGTGNG